MVKKKPAKKKATRKRAKKSPSSPSARKKAQRRPAGRQGEGSKPSQAKTDPRRKPALVTVGNYNMVFRPPAELIPKPGDVARVLRKIAARARKLTEYIRVAHTRGDGGYLPIVLPGRSSVRRLITELEIGFGERCWGDVYRIRQSIDG